MSRFTVRPWLLVCWAIVSATVAAAEDSKGAASEVDGGQAAASAVVQEESVETHHQITIDGRDVSYTATAGTLLLKEEDGTPKASVFFMAYTRDGAADPGSRPITFSFNGGPGSSSVWLHLGVLGYGACIQTHSQCFGACDTSNCKHHQDS